ncbi:ribonuclease HII [Candidatus Saccharibacteria bacterium]|nr:ribonuclease HII [Candidatus Saccharibacteria bacterium]
MILGIDEVGRGPWAGPLVVGAVVLGGATIDGLTDSKKLTKKRREALDTIIREQAVGYGLGWVHAIEIDNIGLSEALKLASRRAVEQIRVPYHEIIIDGTINFLEGTTKGKYVTTMAKADLLVPSVSAASIVAKVARDNYMTEQDDVYEGYGFSSHSGYGTAAHRSAIDALGVTPLHRLSFAPLAKYRHGHTANNELKNHKKDILSLPTAKGNIAEGAVADYLKSHGHEIIDRNWRTKYCEIDIVSTKGGVTYFTEVKYRRQANHGGGFGAITQKKQMQMRFAAEFYIQVKKLFGTDTILAVASVTGDDYFVEDWFVVGS